MSEKDKKYYTQYTCKLRSELNIKNESKRYNSFKKYYILSSLKPTGFLSTY